VSPVYELFHETRGRVGRVALAAPAAVGDVVSRRIVGGEEGIPFESLKKPLLYEVRRVVLSDVDLPILVVADVDPKSLPPDVWKALCR